MIHDSYSSKMCLYHVCQGLDRMQFTCVCSSLPILCINSVSKCNLQQLENNCMLNMCIAGPRLPSDPEHFQLNHISQSPQYWNKFTDQTKCFEGSQGFDDKQIEFDFLYKLLVSFIYLFYLFIHWCEIFMWCFIWYFLHDVLYSAVLASASISRIDIK